jgi:hypothetical protein
MAANVFINISGWIAFTSAIISLVRLCLPKWPVVMTYDRWEYALKVALGFAWFAWAMLILHL